MISCGILDRRKKIFSSFFRIGQKNYSSLQTRLNSRMGMPESRIRQQKLRNFAFGGNLFLWQIFLPPIHVGIRFYVWQDYISYIHEGFYLKIDVGIGGRKVSLWFHFYRPKSKSGLEGAALTSEAWQVYNICMGPTAGLIFVPDVLSDVMTPPQWRIRVARWGAAGAAQSWLSWNADSK